MFIGVDVGGTNSDAVILKDGQVIAWAKETTSDDVTKGVADVVQNVIHKLDKAEKREFKRVCVGTTHFLNAVIQRRQLARVSVVRLCGPASRALPPFIDVTESLKTVLEGEHYFIDGGYYVTGQEFRSVRQEQVKEVAAKILQSGINNVVVSGIFSATNPQQEKDVAKMLTAELGPDISVTMSHQIGNMGLLERENAAILNECLKPLCKKTLIGFQRAFQNLGLKCPIYLTQNDGTLASFSTCLSFPVLTFASGPTNSMRGAAYLARKDHDMDLDNVLVADIGGTTTDLGQLVKGFPRQAAAKVQVGGVNTNFRMPELYSIGLGGGSIVALDQDENVRQVGPISVGCHLVEEAQCCGGEQLTATDLALKTGLLKEEGEGGFGQLKGVKITEQQALGGIQVIEKMLEEAVDNIKISPMELPLLIVGGGGILISQDVSITGVSKVIFPKNYQVANAVGAALAQVSGSFDQIIINTPREDCLHRAKEGAIEHAFQSGAIKDTLEIVDLAETPISYIPGSAVRYTVKAAGDVDPTRSSHVEQDGLLNDEALEDPVVRIRAQEGGVKEDSDRPERGNISFNGVFPYEDDTSDKWTLNSYDVEAISIGAGILGTGGGGSTYLGRLRALQKLKEGKSMQVMKADAYKGAVATQVGFMGAPTVIIEKLIKGTECLEAVRAMETILQKESDALLCIEIGGSNSMEPLSLAADMDLPVLDCDGMGRAFPELQMILPFMLGHPVTPATLVDEQGFSLATLGCKSPKELEDVFRLNVVNFTGLSAAVAFNPLNATEVSDKMVHGSFTRAWHIGHTVLKAVREKHDPFERLLQEIPGSRSLVQGKIVDVSRTTTGGFARGFLRVKSLEPSAERVVKIDFQNENLVAYDETGSESVLLASVPNLICVLETATGRAIQTEDLRYGLRVSVMVLPAPPELLTPRALAVVGPKAFGYDVDVK